MVDKTLFKGEIVTDIKIVQEWHSNFVSWRIDIDLRDKCLSIRHSEYDLHENTAFPAADIANMFRKLADQLDGKL